MSELTGIPFSSPEQAIDAVKWGKRSTWVFLMRKSTIKPWSNFDGVRDYVDLPIKYK